MPIRLALSLLMSGSFFHFHASANEVLLFYDAGFFLMVPSRYQTALENRGYPYQVFTDEFSFTQAVQAADPSADVVVIDALGFFYDFSSVSTFVQAGGRALLQYWNLAADNSLAATFEVSVADQLNWPAFVHDWGGSPFYHDIGTTLPTLPIDAGVHGQKLQPIAGATAVAGFVNSVAANEAALVIGNSDRTIVQGFFIEEIELLDEALQFAQNELDFLFGPIAPGSGPWIISDPQSQTVLAGFGTTLRVQAGGSLPLSYQWQKDGTNVVGATNTTYGIVDARIDEAGSYSVVVSNSSDAVQSGAALLTVVDPPPISNTLLLVNDGTFPSPYEEVLVDLGLPYQKHSDESGFNSAVAAANPIDTLVIVDSYDEVFRHSELVSFTAAGGRALLQMWNLTAGTHLAESFDVRVVEENTTLLPVYDWDGSSFFDDVVSPLALGVLDPSPSVHGQKLQPLAGGKAVAGFVASPTTNEAAVVVGNAGHTIVNGFMLEEAVSSAERTQFARSQVLHFYPVTFKPIELADTMLTLTWTAIPLQDYQVQYKQSPADPSWSDLGPPITADDTTATTLDSITNANQRLYRVSLLR